MSLKPDQSVWNSGKDKFSLEKFYDHIHKTPLCDHDLCKKFRSAEFENVCLIFYKTNYFNTFYYNMK